MPQLRTSALLLGLLIAGVPLIAGTLYENGPRGLQMPMPGPLPSASWSATRSFSPGIPPSPEFLLSHG